MAVEWTDGGIPYLSDESLIGDVPEYTQLMAQGFGVPVGCIMMWMHKSEAPIGWLPLDGSVTDLSPYPKLSALFPGGLPLFGGRRLISGTYNADPAKSNIGNFSDPKMAPSQLVTHQHHYPHGHVVHVGRDGGGATTLAGSPHAPAGSFPISSQGPGVLTNQDVPMNLTEQSVWQNNGQVVDGGNGGLTPLHTDVWTLFIIKHD